MNKDIGRAQPRSSKYMIPFYRSDTQNIQHYQNKSHHLGNGDQQKYVSHNVVDADVDQIVISNNDGKQQPINRSTPNTSINNTTTNIPTMMSNIKPNIQIQTYQFARRQQPKNHINLFELDKGHTSCGKVRNSIDDSATNNDNNDNIQSSIQNNKKKFINNYNSFQQYYNHSQLSNNISNNNKNINNNISNNNNNIDNDYNLDNNTLPKSNKPEEQWKNTNKDKIHTYHYNFFMSNYNNFMNNNTVDDRNMNNNNSFISNNSIANSNYQNHQQNNVKVNQNSWQQKQSTGTTKRQKMKTKQFQILNNSSRMSLIQDKNIVPSSNNPNNVKKNKQTKSPYKLIYNSHTNRYQHQALQPKLIPINEAYLQYQKINMNLTDIQQTKAQIKKYIPQSIRSWVNEMSEQQIEEIYKDVIKDRNFYLERQHHYQQYAQNKEKEMELLSSSHEQFQPQVQTNKERIQQKYMEADPYKRKQMYRFQEEKLNNSKAQRDKKDKISKAQKEKKEMMKAQKERIKKKNQQDMLDLLIDLNSIKNSYREQKTIKQSNLINNEKNGDKKKVNKTKKKDIINNKKNKVFKNQQFISLISDQSEQIIKQQPNMRADYSYGQLQQEEPKQRQKQKQNEKMGKQNNFIIKMQQNPKYPHNKYQNQDQQQQYQQNTYSYKTLKQFSKYHYNDKLYQLSMREQFQQQQQIKNRNKKLFQNDKQKQYNYSSANTYQIKHNEKMDGNQGYYIQDSISDSYFNISNYQVNTLKNTVQNIGNKGVKKQGKNIYKQTISQKLKNKTKERSRKVDQQYYPYQ